MKYGYAENEGTVTLTLPRLDFEMLLVCLGAALAAEDVVIRETSRRVANRINEGRPRSEWIPYAEGAIKASALKLPSYCFSCGAFLKGGATQHLPGCEVAAMIDEVMGRR
jgi:hypothetical protein